MAVREIKDFGHSVRMRLLNVSRTEGQRYQMLLTRYLQERLLYRLSISEHRGHFILKGGALLYAYGRLNARPTLDIDFLGNRINNDKATIANAFKQICEIDSHQDGVKFHHETIRISDIAVEKRYPGIRITLTATLDSVKQDISMDIGFGDIITPGPIELDYPALLEGTNNVSLLAYSLETVIAEKFQTIIERGTSNSRMKDLYDLYIILKQNQYSHIILQEAINVTFSDRNTHYQEDNPFFKKEFRENEGLSLRWQAFMKKLNAPQTPAFGEIVSFIQNSLVVYWENLKAKDSVGL